MVLAEYKILNEKLERIESVILLSKKHCESSGTQTSVRNQTQESQTVAEHLMEQETQVCNRTSETQTAIGHQAQESQTDAENLTNQKTQVCYLLIRNNVLRIFS